jgi:hypothetical protein
MPHKDPEKRRAYYLMWCDKNKERLKEYKKEYQKKNRESISVKEKIYYSANKSKFVGYSWKSRGYPPPTRNKTLVCECCGKPPSKKGLSLDHCHSTGKFRGWLCTRCNVGIGALGDNYETVLQALEYLKRAAA